MKISEMIETLQDILKEKGDLRVTVYDEYMEAEGWDYKNEDLWYDAGVFLDTIENDNGKKLEEVVLIH